MFFFCSFFGIRGRGAGAVRANLCKFLSIKQHRGILGIIGSDSGIIFAKRTFPDKHFSNQDNQVAISSYFFILLRSIGYRS